MGISDTGAPLSLVVNNTTVGAKARDDYATNFGKINEAQQENLDAFTAESAARTLGDTNTLASAHAYVDAQLRGVPLKAQVRVVMTTNLNIASPGTTFDTVAFTNTGVDSILLAGQTDGTQNGVYVWNGATSAMTRRADLSTSTEFNNGFLIVVGEGSVANRDKVWEFTTDGTIILGATVLAFSPIGVNTSTLMNSLSDYGSVLNAPFTAVANTIHRVDISAANIAGTLPTAPADKTIIVAKTVTVSTANTYALTLTCGGSDVFNKTGGSTTRTLTAANESVWLQYNATGGIWVTLASDTPASTFYTKTNADLRFKGAGLGSIGLVSPSHLRRWRVARDDAFFTEAGIAVFGDSISVGVGSNVSTLDSDYRPQGWVGQLRTLFTKTWGDCGEGFIGSPIVDNGARFVLSGGATAYQGAGPMHSGAKSASTTQVITVSVPACTQIDFWVWLGGGDGTVNGTYQVDAGSIVNVSAGNGYSDGALWAKTSVTGLSNATHTIVFKGPNTGNGFYIAGVRAVLQTIGVPVHRVAQSGNTMSNALGLDSGNAGLSAIWEQRLLNAIGVVPAAKLVILALGINDFYQQNNTNQTTQAQPGTTPTTYGTYAQTFCNAAVANGAAVLIVWSPRVDPVGYPSPMTYTEQNYRDVAAAIAANTDHVAMLDIGSAWGEVRSAADTLGLTNTGSVHPNRPGHGDMARLIYETLTSPNLG